MGQIISRGLLASADFELCSGVDVTRIGDDLGSVLQIGHLGVPISNNLQKALEDSKADVAIDFTTPHTVVSNVARCLQEKVPVLVGTTGISTEDIDKLQTLAKQTGTPVLVVPNFAIGALLMMEFAQKAAKYMPHVEIVELHHPQKLDKPSGTAKRTRELILKTLKKDPVDHPELAPIHSVRLPGFVAHQEVIFGDIGQSLSIRHDSFQRESFMPGVLLGLKQLPHVKGLKIGLDL
jgi:4-hydroxy-tetrahydrodipicolinate reductase